LRTAWPHGPPPLRPPGCGNEKSAGIHACEVGVGLVDAAPIACTEVARPKRFELLTPRFVEIANDFPGVAYACFSNSLDHSALSSNLPICHLGASPVLPRDKNYGSGEKTGGHNMGRLRITKRLVDALETTGEEYFVWDADLAGFGVRVRASGATSYIVQYRAGAGRSAPTKRLTIGSLRKHTPDQARDLARKALGSVAHGRDPAADKTRDRRTPTVAVVAERFLTEHVKAKRKPTTHALYEWHLGSLIGPELGTKKVTAVTRSDVAQLHRKLGATTAPTANRVVATLSSFYSFCGKIGIVPEGFNPAKGIEKFRETSRERFLTSEELQRLGSALRDAETIGVPWDVDEDHPNAKHVPKKNRRTVIEPHAAGAIRLLLFTGCRLREILHLKWQHVDFGRGLLFLPDSKTGKKTVVLNAPALAVLRELTHASDYVIAGDDPKQPRSDIKRPWSLVIRHAGLAGLRIHDLRHSFASIGAAGGLGLPIVGKLLGHANASTTARYAHLDADPLRRASDRIGSVIAAALEGRLSSTKGDKSLAQTKGASMPLAL
jgi:integrase